MSVHKPAHPGGVSRSDPSPSADAPGSGRTRRNLRRDERREQLLAAALRAFIRGGYHGTHVSHIVSEAGVARGTFYLHFDSKHEVFAALVQRMLAIVLDARPGDTLERLRRGDAPGPVLEASYRMLLETLAPHRELTRLLFDEAIGIDKGFREELEAHYDAWHERAQEVVFVLQERGLVRDTVDPHISATMLVGMVDRVIRRYLLAEEPSDVDALARALAAFELHGLGVAMSRERS